MFIGFWLTFLPELVYKDALIEKDMTKTMQMLDTNNILKDTKILYCFLFFQLIVTKKSTEPQEKRRPY